jgi:hypothetical protein
MINYAISSAVRRIELPAAFPPSDDLREYELLKGRIWRWRGAYLRPVLHFWNSRL